MKNKYIVIVSQYYHSWHTFIVETPVNTKEVLKRFIEQLEDYKRGSDSNKKEYYYGDLDDRYNRVNYEGRYNLNDSGDMYFIFCDSVNKASKIYHSEKEYQAIHSKGRKLKYVIEECKMHHDYDKVKGIIEDNFTIA